MKTKSESLCKKMPTTGSATVEGSEAWCEKIFFIRTVDLCKEFQEETAKEKCLRNFALKTNNAEICKKIFDYNCSDTIGFRTKKS